MRDSVTEVIYISVQTYKLYMSSIYVSMKASCWALNHTQDRCWLNTFYCITQSYIKTLTCLGPRYTGVAPGHRCHCAAPPTSPLTPADTAAGRRPSWRTTHGKSAQRSQTWQWLQWVHPLSMERGLHRSGMSDRAKASGKDGYYRMFRHL